MSTSTSHPGGWQHRRTQRARLLRFASAARRPAGFGYLDERGYVVPSRPVELWITCRMTHVFGLGLLAGEPPVEGGPDAAELRELAEHGVRALLEGPLHDRQHGGWFAAVDDDGVVDAAKQAYAHAFVVLAASTAATAGLARGEDLLAAALLVQEQRFWDEDAGMVVEEWDGPWSRLDTYRGANSAMHTVEAYLAVGAATGDRRWHGRAARIAGRVAGWAQERDWRVPEHFDQDWRPLPEHNQERPADPFRPYGATVGHGLEWARLMVTVHTASGGAHPGLMSAAVGLAERAVADGWAADGHDGFVYTTDWEGRPVVRQRMHWVVAEAIAASTVLHWATGRARHAADLARWWDYADRHLVDPADGSWRHELEPDGTPAATTWSGRPDVYHAYQAALAADTLGAPSFAAALGGRRMTGWGA
ncbi:AGE family epimerase/isomerase [Ornithinimicrobium avium]|uniref:AGE family epimerase/isomerase n=1 Tax=Ornithinimicrobium avium TaxID=2283195 RepID=A0A345NSB5_9MICO|nr:AGE family epimerase/isomerase [Ornithinimicrobium avium]AXH97923.1 AGE family epimerase/isomerase [Ornithinimicrobium avium]